MSLAVLFIFTSEPTRTHAACTAFTPCTINGRAGTCNDEGAGTCIPNSVSASTGGGGSVNIGVIKGYSDGIINIINGIFVPVLFAIAFLTFLWGVYNYFILGATEEESRSKGKQFVLWGLIGFVVILSVWGLVNIVQSTFGLTSGGNAPARPTL